MINPRPMIPADIQKKVREFAVEVADRIADVLEDYSFDCIVDMPEEWDSCRVCEPRVLNAQESALAILERELLKQIRHNGTFC
jgi:hypothetical protein